MKNRYLKSLGITSGIFCTILGTIYASSDISMHTQKPSKQITQIELITLPKSEPIVESKPIQKETSKQIQPKKIEKIVKKEPKPLPKQIVKPTPKPKPIQKEVQISKKIVKEEIKPISKEIKPIAQTQEIQTKTKETKIKPIEKKSVDTKELEQRKARFFKELKAKIDSNKEYPNTARRRGMQGVVEVSFSISNNGELNNLDILNGKKIFYNSVVEAIKNSFPVDVDKEIFVFPLIITLKINYKLKV
jgi:protein TonB